MAGTYSQIYIQYVFAVKGRANLLHKSWRSEVFQYMSGIISAKEQKSIIINGVEDHVHIFVGLKPSMRISDLVRDIKNNSATFIKNQNFLSREFSWQDGYGVFSYGHSQVGDVYKYIMNQEEHHRKETFKAEYHNYLKKFEVEHDEQFLFDWIE